MLFGLGLKTVVQPEAWPLTSLPIEDVSDCGHGSDRSKLCNLTEWSLGLAKDVPAAAKFC